MRGKRCIMVRKRGMLAALAAAVLTAALALAFLMPRGAALPDFSPRLKTAAEGLSRYDIALKLDAEAHTAAVTESIHFRNDTGATLTDVVLRTWLNAFSDEETSPAATEEMYDACYPEGFSPGTLTLYDVKWNGEAVPYAYLDEARTALSLPVPALGPGEEGDILLRFVAELPVCRYRCGAAGDVWQLGQVIPLLSVWENGAWRCDPYAPVGDPFVTACANFDVTLSLPEGWTPACTAYMEKQSPGVWHGSALAVRDIGLCVSPLYETRSAMQGDTLVTVYTLPGQDAAKALRDARQGLEIFSRLYGEYPYPAYAVCCACFPFGGMEYPALSMIGDAYFAKGRADSMELVLAHETAHQWFYALVGSDQFFQPWQDEALSEYAMLRYVKERYGAGSFETLKAYRVDAPMQERNLSTLTPGSPIDYFASMDDYTAVVYGRGAALLLALDEIVPGGVDGFLRAYAEKYAFALAAREDFVGSLNEYSGMDLEPLVTDYLDTLM